MVRVTNKTHYRTDDLRRLFDAGLRAHADHTNFQIEVYYSRRSGSCSGYAWYHTRRMKLGVPRTPAGAWAVTPEERKPFDELPEHIVRDLARVLIHELCHCLGMRHKEMNDSVVYDETWWKGKRIRARATSKKVPAAEKREQNARRTLERLDRRRDEIKAELDRIRKRRVRWARRVAYYDRKAQNRNGGTEE